MSILSTKTAISRRIIRNGLLIGVVGGLAEVVVITTYAASTGGDAAIVARAVATAAGLSGGSAVAGIAVHMALAIALGLVLAIALSMIASSIRTGTMTYILMVGSLATVWAVNFFIVLPAVSPSFVHLMPYPVSLASKLAFGLAAAVTLTVTRLPPLTPAVADRNRALATTV